MNGIYSYFNRFWDYNSIKPFTLSEHALFHLLLNEANRRHWQMPVAMSTTIAAVLLKTTRQNVLKARQGLLERGIIQWKEGTNRNKLAEYTLLDEKSPALTKGWSPETDTQLSQELSQQLSQELSQQLSHYNIYKKGENISYNIEGCQAETELTLLKDKLSNDSEWASIVVKAIASPKIQTPDDVFKKLDNFVAEPEAKGTKTREENDFKNHFINWLKINNKYSNQNFKLSHELSHNQFNQRRGTETSNGTADDFEKPFNSAN